VHTSKAMNYFRIFMLVFVLQVNPSLGRIVQHQLRHTLKTI